MLREVLQKRNLPPLKSKEEMLDILLREEYGYLPPKPDKVTWVETDNYIPCFCAGKATIKKVDITSYIGDKTFTFPVYVSIPVGKEKYPFFVSLNFRDSVPDRFMPTEEIIDNGFAVLSFSYLDITSDDNDFTTGLAGVLFNGKTRSDSDAAKLSLWAWAAHRVMDYAETIGSLDKNCSIVCGHSRLGKTALLAAATDERFAGALANGSGCSGASITRDKIGERVREICQNFPQWSSGTYKKYIDKESEMPFDQHYLVAAIAPRPVCVSTAIGEHDPVSEMLTCIAASPAYEKYGKPGFVSLDRLPVVGDRFHDGNIGFQMRDGIHYFSREDWNCAIEFFKKRFNIE